MIHAITKLANGRLAPLCGEAGVLDWGGKTGIDCARCLALIEEKAKVKTEILEALQNLVDSCYTGQFEEAFREAKQALQAAKNAPPERKIVQIAAAGNSLYAACSDGAIFECVSAKWLRLPPIPQDAP